MKLLPTLLASLAAPSKLLGPLAHLGPLGVAAAALVAPAVGAQEAAPPRGDGLELFEARAELLGKSDQRLGVVGGGGANGQGARLAGVLAQGQRDLESGTAARVRQAE